jgi:Gpi18-like mannosyltransferase
VSNFSSRLSGLANKLIPSSLHPRKTTILKWLLIGYLVRIIFIPLQAHMDHMTFIWISSLLTKNNQLLPSGDPPLLFYFYRSYFTLTQPLLPTNIINFLTSNVGFTPATLLQDFAANQQNIRTLLFVSKMPFLIFDFATAILILHLLSDGKKSLSAFKVWMLNPFLVYITYVVGQFDIIPVFFAILALYLLKRQRLDWAMLSLGISSAFKFIGLFLIPPIIIIYVKNNTTFFSKIKHAFKLSSICALPLIFAAATSFLTPVYYESANFAISGYNLNGFFGKTLYNRGELGSPLILGSFLYIFDYSISLQTLPNWFDVIYILPLGYLLFLLAIIYRNKWTFDGMWKALSVFLLAYYSISLFHVQWFLWIQPFFALLIAEDYKRFLKLYLFLIPLYAVYSFYWNPYALSFIGSLGLPSIKVVNLFRAFFSATCIFIAFLVVKDRLIEIIGKRINTGSKTQA